MQQSSMAKKLLWLWTSGIPLGEVQGRRGCSVLPKSNGNSFCHFTLFSYPYCIHCAPKPATMSAAIPRCCRLQRIKRVRLTQTRCLGNTAQQQPLSGRLGPDQTTRPRNANHFRKHSAHDHDIYYPQENLDPALWPQKSATKPATDRGAYSGARRTGDLPPPAPAPPARTPKSTKSGVKINVDGEPHEFSSILLRDLCGCSQCVDPSTRQKYRLTTDIPATIRPRAIAQTETGVSIVWDNDASGYDRDHTTEINAETLRQYIDTGFTVTANSSFGPRSLWSAAEYNRLPDMSYDEYMQSDSALYRMLMQLHTHGLAFLTEVPGSEKSVSAIAERIGPVKNTFYGYTWDVRSVPESKNVAYTSQDLGFHMDLLYMEQPPHLQFLHCIRSSAAGGASLFTDSLRSASDLLDADTGAFNSLANNTVNFHYNHPSSALYHQSRRVLEVDGVSYRGGVQNMLAAYSLNKHRAAFPEKNQIEEVDDIQPMEHVLAVSWSPPFQAPFGRRIAQNEPMQPLDLTSERLHAWHSAAQKFNQLIHRPEMIYERMMKPGECVLFDNRRVLHARKAFEVGDVGKERWLRGAYLDKDPYMSKLRVLQHQLGKNAGENAGEEATQGYFEAAAGA